MSALQSSHILVGVTGGIAAYKTPHLVRLLRQAGADVQVVMTASAKNFVTPTALQAVSGHPVRDTLWDPAAEAQMGHIELARWADLVLIAPATADRLSRLAGGHADDLLGALCLATRAPIVIAPAMNQVMWEAPATRRNAQVLGGDGFIIVGPEHGDQACGEVGPGRMTEPESLVGVVETTLSKSGPDVGRPAIREVQLDTPAGGLSGRHVVITAGPTREAIDPVRYISNHSSGKQGYAMAAAARDAGARVTQISGPVAEPVPTGVDLVRVESAQEMLEASLSHAAACDLFIAVAAVADYRPATAATRKIKKKTAGDGAMHLTLVENPDIVASVAVLANRPLVVGFAAETHDAIANGREKLQRKGLDAIVVNDVSRSDIGFASDDNAATLIWADGELALRKQSKHSLARTVIEQLTAVFVRQLAHTNPENVAN
ncbi:MAG: bifunctional phosphopantothenoylcysteine decarboxylase/phosphopantothenate--cysteine ligase CoaBC [Gammaproteobacteria bacterium]